MAGIKDFVVRRNALFGDTAITKAVSRAMGAYQSLADVAKAAGENKNLSAAGMRKEIVDFARKNAHEVVRVRKAAEKARADLAARRAKLLPTEIDKGDAASAMVRSEIRNRLFQMSPGEKKALIQAGKIDPLTCAAILEAPSSLTGIEGDYREAVRSIAIEHAHPGALQKIEKDGEAVELLNVAAKVLVEHVAELVDIPARALDDFINEAVPDQRHIVAEIERAA